MLTPHFTPNSRAGRIVLVAGGIGLAYDASTKWPFTPRSEVRGSSVLCVIRWVECPCWMMMMYVFSNPVPLWNMCWLDTKTAG